MRIRLGKQEYQVNRHGIKPIMDDFFNKKELTGNNRLNGLKCIVIGGNAGIGLAIVKAFLREGALVVAGARHKKQLVSISDDRLSFVPWDVSKLDDSQMMLNKVYHQLEGVDVLVNCAGVNWLPNNKGSQLQQIKNDLHYQHTINVLGTAELCNAFKNIVKQNDHKGLKKPKVINVISAGGYIIDSGSYFTSKQACRCFTEAFAENSKDILSVYGIAPGEVRTDMIRHANFTVYSYLARDRRKASPDEIAELAVMMASDAGDLLSGNIAILNGGESMPFLFV